MRYISTRGKAPAVNFKKALFTGLAPDGGLYIPDRIPYFTPSGIAQLKDKSYVSLAISLIYPFVAEDIRIREFSKIMNDSIKVFSKHSQPLLGGVKNIPESQISEDNKENKKIHPVPAPLRILDDNLALMELFHGPTLAFKDFALQLLAGLMNHLLQQEQYKTLILAATSGDTGSAAIEAFRHYPDIKIVILHPHNRITPYQRRQMTTTGAENVWNLAVEGNFDDCQQLVKDCFNERDFLPSDYCLTAVNSINWARIIAQIVYYFSAFFQAGCDLKRKTCFTVPTGNFGNILAGYYAKCMGLPIDKLLVAVNQNDILYRLFSDNDYRVTEIKPSYSPSMDILVSSNLERLIYLVNNSFEPRSHIVNNKFMHGTKETGKLVNRIMRKFKSEKKIRLDDNLWEKAKETFLSFTSNDEETLNTIAQCYRDYGMVVDPHTAVGLHAALTLREDALKDVYNIVLSTAHPAKFADVIEKSGVPLPPPPLNPDEEASVEQFEVFPNDLEKLKGYLLGQVLR